MVQAVRSGAPPHGFSVSKVISNPLALQFSKCMLAWGDSEAKGAKVFADS